MQSKSQSGYQAAEVQMEKEKSLKNEGNKDMSENTQENDTENPTLPTPMSHKPKLRPVQKLGITRSGLSSSEHYI